MSLPRVDFYILESTAPDSRLRFACRLTEKAYGLETRVYACVPGRPDAEALDELLWTFRQGSFVPHEIAVPGKTPRAPVAIGTIDQPAPSGDLLINLTDQPPAFAHEFPRIAEIVAGDEASREAGRARFRHYREQGLNPETHKITA